MKFLQEYTAHSDPAKVVLLAPLCPACEFEHSFRVDAEYWEREGKDVWEFNGDSEKPTFGGSMLSQNPQKTRICHSYVEDGLWRFLEDSTHEMAGQGNVPMIPYPDDYWERRRRDDG